MVRVVKDSGASRKASKAEVEVLYKVEPDDLRTTPEDDNKKLFSLRTDYKLIFFGAVGLSSNFTCSRHLFSFFGFESNEDHVSHVWEVSACILTKSIQ